MSILALVTRPDEVEPVVSWAAHFARARETSLTVLCWIHSPAVEYPLLDNGEADPKLQQLETAARQVADRLKSDCPDDLPRPAAEETEIRGVRHPNAVAAALGRIQIDDPELVVAASPDPTGLKGATYVSNALLRQSPCNTVILYAVPGRSCTPGKVVVGTADNPHDRVAVSLAAHLTRCHAEVTVVRVEENTGEEAPEVGRRELRQLMHEAGIVESENIHTRVLLADAMFPAAKELVADSDLVLVAANRQRAVQQLLATTPTATIAVVKRSPPLKIWPFVRAGRNWIPRLNPGDYADLVQSLRRGSRFSADFMIMLGLAAAIASLGLLQDSPAVVIGSMLLAPLMTPMVASGLALAQANPKLAHMCIKSVFWGFLMTLLVGYLVGITMPGQELTPQVIARGDPNLLDLFIALCSAVAAAYAMARPNILGAVAGVAIATALVPPLCSVGISLAYHEYLNALGAGLLFLTNWVAIVLAAAVTFRALGVVASQAAPRQRRWFYQNLGLLIVIAILLAIPLERALQRQVEQGKPRPLAFPVSASVADAVQSYVAGIERPPGVEVMLMGRSSRIDTNLVAIYLTSPEPLPRSHCDEIVRIVRHEMQDDGLDVHVICVQEAWNP